MNRGYEAIKRAEQADELKLVAKRALRWAITTVIATVLVIFVLTLSGVAFEQKLPGWYLVTLIVITVAACFSAVRAMHFAEKRKELSMP